MPSGWSYFIAPGTRGSNLSISGGKLQIGQVDTAGGIYRSFDTSGATRVQIDYDAGIPNTAFGGGVASVLTSNILNYNFGPGRIQAGAGKTSGGGAMSSIFDYVSPTGIYQNAFTGALGNQSGSSTFHFSTTYQDGLVSQTLTNLASGQSFSSGNVAISGFKLSDMSQLALFGVTTTGASGSFDNVKITETKAVADPPPPTCTSPQVLQTGVCVTPAIPPHPVPMPFSEPSPTITAEMLIPPANSSAGNAPPTLGGTARYVWDYYRQNSDHAALEAAYNTCELHDGDPDPAKACDLGEFDRQVKLGYAKWAHDLGVIAIEANSALQGRALGAVAVDMSAWDSLWDGTLIGKVKKITDVIGDIKSAITNAIDFFKKTTPTNVPNASASLSDTGRLDPVIVNSFVGSMNWGESGDIDWLLSDLKINVDIAKEYFQDLSIGQTFGSHLSLFPGADAFGVFTVEDFVDPPGYNTVTLSLRQLELFNAVPEPSTLVLFTLSGAALDATRRRGRLLSIV